MNIKRILPHKNVSEHLILVIQKDKYQNKAKFYGNNSQFLYIFRGENNTHRSLNDT